MIAFSGCDKASSAKCLDIGWQQFRDGRVGLEMRARDDIIINRGNCIYAGPKTLAENIDLKFGEWKSILIRCKPLEVVFKTNLGQCEYKFD